MRIIRSFILRLFIDSDSPEALRGALQDLSHNEIESFTSVQSLLAMLQRLSAPDYPAFDAAIHGNSVESPPDTGDQSLDSS